MILLGLLCMAAVLGAFFGFSAAGSAKKALVLAEQRAVTAEKALHGVDSRLAAKDAELTTMRAELREEKDAHKALKKKRFDDKKPAVAGPDERTLALDQAWRKADAEVTALKTRIAELEARPVEKVVVREEVVKVVEKAAAPAAPAVDEKQLNDLRRKLEWHRRIHVLQQKELELERDKTAHVRKRFLDVCRDLVRMQKPDAETQREIERLTIEQSAHEAQEQQAESNA